MKTMPKAVCVATILFASIASAIASPPPSAREIRAEAYRSLSRLHVALPNTAALGKQAYAVAVFPAVRGFGFLIGAESGTGVLFMGQNAMDYYQLHSFAGGLTFGWRKYSVAIFFLTKDAFEKFIADKGLEATLAACASLETSDFPVRQSKFMHRKDVIKFAYNDEGAMLHLGPQFTQISEAKISK